VEDTPQPIDGVQQKRCVAPEEAGTDDQYGQHARASVTHEAAPSALQRLAVDRQRQNSHAVRRADGLLAMTRNMVASF
jgi:hypothetical protein